MALGRRPSEPFWVVFHFDPALAGVPNATFRDYLFSRDISKMPIDLVTKTCKLNGEPVAMCKCKPMSRKDYTAWISDPLGLKGDVVRTHVVEVHNIDGARCDTDRNDPNKVCLTEESLDNLDEAVTTSILDAIVDAAKGAQGEDRPFTLPAGFLGDRARSLQLPAVIAMRDKTVKPAGDEGK